MSREVFTSRTDAHKECWDLLPWVANERIGAQELARIELHLRECEACREELESQRRLRTAMRSEEPVVLAPQNSLQKLMQRIDAGGEVAELVSEPKETRRQFHPEAITHTRAPAARRTHWLAIAAVAQGIVIAALLATVWMQSRERLSAPRYETLTSSAVVANGPVIRVRFADDIGLRDVDAILRAIDAQIVAGPSVAGVYTLSPKAADADRMSVEHLAARLRADPRVLFAEAALARH